MSVFSRELEAMSGPNVHQALYGPNGNRRVALDDKLAEGANKLRGHMASLGLGELSAESVAHWAAVNLAERRAFIETEEDKEARVEEYARNFGEMIGQALHLAGRASSARADLHIPAFDFDEAIVDEAAKRVHRYLRDQGLLAHLSVMPVSEPLVLPTESSPLYYKSYQLSVSGWRPPKP